MESIWSNSCDIRKRESLKSDINVDVAVIGAGMAGILIAYKLKQAGKDVIVIDANRIASGQTRNTTAKITSQHGCIYNKLISDFGIEKAKQYARANQEAIEEYENIITNNNIDCDFERVDSYLYSIKDEKLMRTEAESAYSLGLPASFVTQTSLPFSIAGAVKFKNQAQFNPIKFLNHISNDLKIYENISVSTVEDNIIKANDFTITANSIVFACHYPFINFPGLYFSRMHQERSYVIAVDNAPQLNGMYIGIEDCGYSFRNYKDYLLIGGYSHRTGENSQGGKYSQLRTATKKLFPDCVEIANWSAQDCITADGIPYIGQYASSKPNWFVATGFNKWGMTSSMVSANMISNIICGKDTPYSEVFNPSRFPVSSIPKIMTEVAHAVKGLSKENISIPKTILDELPHGHGGIINVDGKKVGVYKTNDSKVYIVDTRCPHLGCQVEWNPDEKTWDCPCHGSRFDYTGKLINNPAQEGIEIE